MGNQQGKSKKSKVKNKANNGALPQGRPSSPGTPEVQGPDILGRSTPDGLILRWDPPVTDGGSDVTGYIIEKRELFTDKWTIASPGEVRYPQAKVTHLKNGIEYQFRVSAVNTWGVSVPSTPTDPTNSEGRMTSSPPKFYKGLRDAAVLEHERLEFTVIAWGAPAPSLTWFKDGMEIMDDGRMELYVDGEKTTLVFTQVSLRDEGEVKCVAVNKSGMAETKARLLVEAPPQLQIQKMYEEGLLFEAGEMIRLKVGFTGRPTPEVTWFHEGERLSTKGRYEIETGESNSTLRVTDARRADRGEYFVRVDSQLGEDAFSYLVTVTDRPQYPGKPVVKEVSGNSCVLEWTPPRDDGGCKIGCYIVEYFRVGWNVWLKAVTSRNLSARLNDLISGSEYLFRVKAENPYGSSEPSLECGPVFIADPKRGIVKSNQIQQEDQGAEGDSHPVAPPRIKKRVQTPVMDRKERPSPSPEPYYRGRLQHCDSADSERSSEFMLVLLPDANEDPDSPIRHNRRSFPEDVSPSPPKLSVSGSMSRSPSPPMPRRRRSSSRSPSPIPVRNSPLILFKTTPTPVARTSITSLEEEPAMRSSMASLEEETPRSTPPPTMVRRTPTPPTAFRRSSSDKRSPTPPPTSAFRATASYRSSTPPSRSLTPPSRSLTPPNRSSTPPIGTSTPPMRSSLSPIKSSMPQTRSSLSPIKSSLSPIKPSTAPIRSSSPPNRSSNPPNRSSSPPNRSSSPPIRSSTPPNRSTPPTPPNRSTPPTFPVQPSTPPTRTFPPKPATPPLRSSTPPTRSLTPPSPAPRPAPTPKYDTLPRASNRPKRPPVPSPPPMENIMVDIVATRINRRSATPVDDRPGTLQPTDSEEELRRKIEALIGDDDGVPAYRNVQKVVEEDEYVEEDIVYEEEEEEEEEDSQQGALAPTSRELQRFTTRTPTPNVALELLTEEEVESKPVNAAQAQVHTEKQVRGMIAIAINMSLAIMFGPYFIAHPLVGGVALVLVTASYLYQRR